LGHFEAAEMAAFTQKVVFVDDKNAILSVETHKTCS